MDKIIALAMGCGHIHVYEGAANGSDIAKQNGNCWRCQKNGPGSGSDTADIIQRWQAGKP